MGRAFGFDFRGVVIHADSPEARGSTKVTSRRSPTTASMPTRPSTPKPGARRHLSPEDSGCAGELATPLVEVIRRDDVDLRHRIEVQLRRVVLHAHNPPRVPSFALWIAASIRVATRAEVHGLADTRNSRQEKRPRDLGGDDQHGDVG
jgi:hypothetical protein